MKKVLVVDDTKNIRNLLTTCLELEGFETMTANDGTKALELLLNYNFDLVFLDIKLPELSGTEVLRRIREYGLPIPVVIMTAFATVKNAVECTKMGAVAYLQKPFTAEKVRSVLREMANSEVSVSAQLDSLISIARERLLQGKADEAFQQLKLALAINPNCGIIYFLLAKVYRSQGNTEEAKRFEAIARQFGDHI